MGQQTEMMLLLLSLERTRAVQKRIDEQSVAASSEIWSLLQPATGGRRAASLDRSDQAPGVEAAPDQ
jgi:hypothetical protein